MKEKVGDGCGRDKKDVSPTHIHHITKSTCTGDFWHEKKTHGDSRGTWGVSHGKHYLGVFSHFPKKET